MEMEKKDQMKSSLDETPQYCSTAGSHGASRHKPLNKEKRDKSTQTDVNMDWAFQQSSTAAGGDEIFQRRQHGPEKEDEMKFLLDRRFVYPFAVGFHRPTRHRHKSQMEEEKIVGQRDKPTQATTESCSGITATKEPDNTDLNMDWVIQEGPTMSQSRLQFIRPKAMASFYAGDEIFQRRQYGPEKEDEMKFLLDKRRKSGFHRSTRHRRKSQLGEEKIVGQRDKPTQATTESCSGITATKEPDNTDWKIQEGPTMSQSRLQAIRRSKSMLSFYAGKEFDVKQQISRCGTNPKLTSKMHEYDEVKLKQQTKTAGSKNSTESMLGGGDADDCYYYCSYNTQQPKQQETIVKRKCITQSAYDSCFSKPYKVDQPNQVKTAKVLEIGARSNRPSSECLPHKGRAQFEFCKHASDIKHTSYRSCDTVPISKQPSSSNTNTSSVADPSSPRSQLPFRQSAASCSGESGLFSTHLESMSHGQPAGKANLQTINEHRPLPLMDHQLSYNDSCWPGSQHLALESKALDAGSCQLKEFTPVITPDFDDETYRFQFSCPGLYQCSVTGLVFHMKGEGDVVYRSVPWNRRLLSQHHKKPAGPLFDIKCLQQSVSQLHLPHCEILSTGGGQFLSVAHVSDEDIEFISPHQITETHVVINITGFSGFGNVKDEDSPPDPVRALVLLFYRPPAHTDPTSLLNVLLTPRNIVIRDVQRTRRKLIGDEMFIDTYSHCKLQPQHLYSLSTCPQDSSVKIQPAEVEFDEESHSSYFTSVQVILRRVFRNIDLSLKDKNSSLTVWESEVFLSFAREGMSSGPSTQNQSATRRLSRVRRRFIDGISESVLQDLLDKLLEKRVISDSERESGDRIENRGDKARFVIDTVRKKGEAASSEMIQFLCEVDPFLCEHLGLN